jgi:hypothetical protein
MREIVMTMAVSVLEIQSVWRSTAMMTMTTTPAKQVLGLPPKERASHLAFNID